MSDQHDEIVEGVVNGVGFTPGREDGLLSLELSTPGVNTTRSVLLLAHGSDADILIDKTRYRPGGYPDEADWLISWLFNTRCRAKVWLRMSHYGSAVRAEFTTMREAP